MGFGGLKKTKKNPNKLGNVRSQQLWTPKIMSGGENVKKKCYHYFRAATGSLVVHLSVNTPKSL
jgi:hypothetical protein